MVQMGAVKEKVYNKFKKKIYIYILVAAFGQAWPGSIIPYTTTYGPVTLKEHSNFLGLWLVQHILQS